MTDMYTLSTPSFVRSGASASRALRSAGAYDGAPTPTPRSASQQRDLALNDLVEVFMAHREAGANGYGSAPADRASFGYAVGLLHRLPPTVPDPDVSADPDGEVALEWYAGPRRTLSVSVGSDGQLRYAALVGAEEVAGRARFDGRTVPSVVVTLAHRAMNID